MLKRLIEFFGSIDMHKRHINIGGNSPWQTL